MNKQTNEEILKRAIERALRNKWTPPMGVQILIGLDRGWNGVLSDYNLCLKIIFSHDFAKAFWGTDKRGYDFVKKREIQDWDHHLQQMVLEPDPIQYLARFLEEGTDE